MVRGQVSLRSSLSTPPHGVRASWQETFGETWNSCVRATVNKHPRNEKMVYKLEFLKNNEIIFHSLVIHLHKNASSYLTITFLQLPFCRNHTFITRIIFIMSKRQVLSSGACKSRRLRRLSGQPFWGLDPSLVVIQSPGWYSTIKGES